MHAMQVCAKHGKKRQVVYLQRCPQTNEWVCKPTDQCKLCGNGNSGNGSNSHRNFHFNKERQSGRLSRHSDSEWFISQPRDAREKFTPPERSITRGSELPASEKNTANAWLTLEIPPRSQTEEKSTPSLPQEEAIEAPTSTSIITSWADEVDKEFPFPQNDVSPVEELPADNLRQPADISVTTDGGPAAFSTPFSFSHSKPISTEYKSCNKLSLVERVEILEEELSVTKKELNKTRQNLSRIIQNEKTMETKVRNLCSEIIRMRQQQLQLDLSCRSSEERRNGGLICSNEGKVPNSKHVVIGGRLNPEAVPFLPSTQMPQHVDSGLSSPTADSARSLPNLESTYSAQFSGSSLSLKPALAASSTLQVDSARSTQHADSARSTQHMDSARTGASARSSSFSVATNGSIISLDSDQLDQFSPRF